ncbi:Scr1 family TA system antitoxin-like transcriptional regulator [Streptomyces albidoflavus]|uniref:Scr1 family TA system antitoxin-like transcriptional regulator n=1 Tax=Streptomyces albidoflavus TaxID=1886 RepID=UPI0033A5C233
MSAPTLRRRRLGAKLRTLRGELTLDEVRLARQVVLTRDTPVNLWAIIPEHALGSSSKADGAMHERLSRVLTMGKQPNVNIHVLPSDAPVHVGRLGSFTLPGFAPHPDLNAVHTETLTSAAASVEASAGLITQVRKKL